MLPQAEPVNPKTQLLCVWTAPITQIMWMIGFFCVSGLFPPLSPAASAEQIAAFFHDNQLRIHIGLVITMMGAAFMGPFFAVISQQMARVDSTLAKAQLGLGMLMILLFVMPCFDLGAAAFRPERAASEIMAYNDTAWLAFVSGFQTTFVQWLTIAACILLNKEQKVFPRWLGYFNIAAAIGLVPCAFTFFTKTGPFAWDGLLALWFVVVAFVAWFLVMFWEVRKIILAQT